VPASRHALKLVATVAALLVTAGLCAVAPPAGSTTAAAPQTLAASPVPGLPSGVPPAALHAEPTLPRPAGWPFPDRFSRTSGTSRLAGGALEWTDFLYDDHGAVGSGTPSGVTSLAPARGTYTYPQGKADGNGADIFRAAIGLSGSNTYWRVDWNTLDDPSIPVAAFAIDSDGNASTGVAAWGAGTGLRSAGIDHVLVISSRGAWVIDAVTHVRRLVPGAVTVDHHADRALGSFVAKVPTSFLPARTRPWTARLAAGLAAPGGAAFAAVPATDGALPGQPAVYNVSFRTARQETGRFNFWMESAQALALTTGDVSAFSLPVDWAALAAKRSTGEPLVTGYTNRWYVSSIELGKGVVADAQNNPAGDLRPNFLGRVQPYAVYVPTHAATGPRPLTWLLHSLGVQHNQYGALNPKFLQQTCEARDSICATTLGRGPDGWYFDEAELDFWEVWHALATSFSLDPERTVLSGYSMGGWATYKLGLAYPDLFANAVVMAGPPVCGIRVTGDTVQPAGPGRCTDDGKTMPLLGNARWLPYQIFQGGADELVPVAGVLEQVNDIDALGYRHHFELYPSLDHLAWATADLFAAPAAHMGSLKRTRDPGRITYSWYPNLSRPAWGIGPTGVYWVRGLRARDTGPGVLGSLDISSSAHPDQVITPVRSSGAVLTPDTPPVPGTFSDLRWRLGARPIASPLITARLTDVAALSFTLGRAGIAPGHAARISVQTDGPTTLGLTGLAPGERVQVRGRTVHASPSGAASVALPSGVSTVSLG
jgi:pimeloyl-ACP methyl ester carboxylesterase